MFKLKRFLKVGALVGVISLILGAFIYSSITPSEATIKSNARKASVQVVFHIPILKVTFTQPLPSEEKLTMEKFNEVLKQRIKEIDEKIKETIEKETKKLTVNKYETTLTEINVYGYEPVSKTAIPLGALAPKYAKFPQRVLVVAEIEKKNIEPWKKEYENDVLTISETANVSPSKAQQILLNLNAKGYTISKEEIKKSTNVKLLWFSDGWDDKYPLTLPWTVEIEGTNNNIIVGYDPVIGVLEVKPIPDGKRIHVKASYFDLKSEFKEKSSEIKGLEAKIDELKKEKQDLEEQLDKAIKELAKREPESKRDISNATWSDVRYGMVKIERYWALSAASGVFLGNTRINNEFSSWSALRGWMWYQHDIFKKEAGVILTNAHVARIGIDFAVYVSEDKETMWIVYPGAPFVRYTPESDFFGSPAEILAIEQMPVISYDYDCGLLVTTSVPQYEKYKAKLGDSSKVKQGERIVMVGNPIGYQKFLSEGVISNTHYSALDTLNSGVWLKYLSKIGYNWLKNSNIWFDTPIGIGGTSGSGVWALSGSQRGKVIALHNMGLAVALNFSTLESKKVFKANSTLFGNIKDSAKQDFKQIFSDYSIKEALYNTPEEEFVEDNPDFIEALEESGLWVNVPGMNGGVAINKIKCFLQERGLDPDNFNWEGVSSSYWER